MAADGGTPIRGKQNLQNQEQLSSLVSSSHLLFELELKSVEVDSIFYHNCVNSLVLIIINKSKGIKF